MYFIRNREGLALTIHDVKGAAVVSFSRRRHSVLAFGTLNSALAFYSAIRNHIGDECSVVCSDDEPGRETPVSSWEGGQR